MKHFIEAEGWICEEKRLVFKFRSSLNVFRKKNFFIEYDMPLGEPPESILMIPFAAVMAPIAWSAGAELRIPSLDKNYAESLERCSRYFRKWFSKKWSFKSELKTNLVEHSYAPDRYAMLFSGGLDSLTTYLGHKDKNPLLFTVFGTDIPLSQTKFIELCRKKFNDFARQENAENHFIRTDINEVLDLKKLKTYASNWYGEVAHGLIMSSLLAPVSYHSVKTLLVASCSHPPACTYPCGSEKELLQEVRWGNTEIENAHFGMTRSQKIREFFKPNENSYSFLRVCWLQFKSLNCGHCEKCLRTICELLINNIDPALCNFEIDSNTLLILKKRMQKQYYFFFHGESALDFWRAIQQAIDLDRMEDRYGSLRFFRWFKDFEKIKKRQDPALLHLSENIMHLRTWAGTPLRRLRENFRSAKKTFSSSRQSQEITV